MTFQAHCNWWAFYGTHQLQCRLQQVGGTVRTGGNTFYLLNDHLTSTAITANSSGVRQTELRYFAYGGTRYDVGGQMTIYRYTGQRVETGTGLYDYGARWYDPAIGRFLVPDSIVPNVGSSQSLNRYAYVNGNPLKYTDPSGHWLESAIDVAFIIYDIHDIATNGLSLESGAALALDVGGLILPVVTGAGLLVRAAGHADDVARAVSHSDEIVKAATHADEAAAVVRQAENAGELANRADNNVVAVQRSAATPQINQASRSPDFVVTPKGEAIPVPQGATGPHATRSSGMQFTGGSGGHGMDTRVDGVRIMDANNNQGPRAVYMNRSGQTVNPATGRTTPKNHSAAHHYLKKW